MVLEKEEIKDLTSGFWTGETTPFDFVNASLKKDEKIQTAGKLHVSVAEKLSKTISQMVESEIVVEFVKHETATGKDVLASINPEQSMIVTWHDEQAGIEGLINLDRSLFFKLYGLFFGGNRPFEKKGSLTPLEQSFFEKLFSILLSEFQVAWEPIGHWQFELYHFIETPEQAAQLGWGFDCFKANFKITLPNKEEAAITAIFPKEMLNAIGELTDGDKVKALPAGKDRHWIEAVKNVISDMTLPIEIWLGNIPLNLGTVLKIKEGDAYPLCVEGDTYDFLVNSTPMFKVSLGTVDGSRAVQVEEKIMPQEGEHS